MSRTSRELAAAERTHAELDERSAAARCDCERCGGFGYTDDAGEDECPDCAGRGVALERAPPEIEKRDGDPSSILGVPVTWSYEVLVGKRCTTLRRAYGGGTAECPVFLTVTLYASEPSTPPIYRAGEWIVAVGLPDAYVQGAGPDLDAAIDALQARLRATRALANVVLAGLTDDDALRMSGEDMMPVQDGNALAEVVP
ncbi:MAG: hypothetical protein K8H88_18270 [Sandaracinaceae bacterium]|nr:hypothetical protein [Sandaracinaceae bacterium]